MQFTDQNFETEVIKSTTPTLVDFFAPRCGPCQMMGPIIDELTEELKDQKVKIGKLDIDQNPEITKKYNVMSVPTLIIFQNGEAKETMSGVQNKEELKEKLEKLTD